MSEAELVAGISECGLKIELQADAVHGISAHLTVPQSGKTYIGYGRRISDALLSAYRDYSQNTRNLMKETA